MSETDSDDAFESPSRPAKRGRAGKRAARPKARPEPPAKAQGTRPKSTKRPAPASSSSSSSSSSESEDEPQRTRRRVTTCAMCRSTQSDRWYRHPTQLHRVVCAACQAPAPTAAGRKGRGRKQKEVKAWPGPGATLNALLKKRAEAKAEREQRLAAGGQAEAEEVEWNPDPAQATGKAKPTASPRSLFDLCVDFVARHMDQISEELEHVAPHARVELARALSRRAALTDDDVRKLFAHGSVAEIALPDCSGLNEGALVDALEQCGPLRVLRLRYAGRAVGRSAAARLARHRASLEELQITGAFRLPDAALRGALEGCAALRALDLSHAERLTLETLTAACSLGALRELTLDRAAAGVDDLAAPLALLGGRLERLSARGVAGLTDGALAAAAAGGRLEALAISECPLLTEAGLAAALEACGGALRELDLAHNAEAVSDTVLLRLRAPLRRVSLAGCFHVTDAGVGALAAAANDFLEDADLSHVQALTDAGLAELARRCARALARVDVSFCRAFTDNGLGLLATRCARLKRVTLWGCSQVTDKFFGNVPKRVVVHGRSLGQLGGY